MNLGKVFLRNVFCGLAVLALAASANAAIVITGQAWVVPEATASNAVIASVTPLGAANVNFTLNSLSLNLSSASGYDFGHFIASGGNLNSGSSYANNATASTQLDFTDPWLSPVNYGNCSTTFFSFTDVKCGSIFKFTGSAYFVHNQTYSVTSDDGATMYVGGTALTNVLLSHPGSQSPSVTSGVFAGTTGTYGFTLVYGECCGTPADLSTSLQSAPSVPEPSSVVLFGTVLLGVVSLLRRKKIA